MTNVLFVCTGNTCRSPMAEALLNHLKNSDNISVKSAGVFAFDGSTASPNAIEALKEKGITCEHQSSSLTKDLVEWATIILTMTNQHKQSVIDQHPYAGRKTFTLSEYVSDQDGEKRDISDPFGGPLPMYRQTLSDLEELISKLVDKLNK
ncbi:low molecular weight protein arginine phosphatase [Metabacillus litoralis]|uniref:low molecular weight protein arginine phosphatase n=1 Tax=Metabacillus litoralis TaxID=152268 RepID=UPI000EF5F258|nr:low molecular weight protein arginine phosphatase [Metabacillus litoralis]MCM3411546.1 low molecular weight protein arginine phosphatase [Metabacillus litoralis]